MSSSAANSPTANPDRPGSEATGGAAPSAGVPAEIVVHKRTYVQGRPAVYSVAGAGMPVILLHGWALADNTYRNVISRIAGQGCRVIAPAMPGFGGTHDLPKQQFSIGGYARWLANLLEALELDEPAVVVGHSFGGGVAIRFAHDHPRRVRSLVL